MCQAVELARDNTHFSNCQYTALLRLRRHNNCTAHIADAWRALHGYAVMEPRKLSDNNRNRPDIDGFLGMNRFILDFTCRNDVSSSQLGRDIVGIAERNKIQHYRDMAIGLRATFVPFVTLAFGGFSPAAMEFV